MESGTIIKYSGRVYTVLTVVEAQPNKYAPPAGSLLCVTTDETGKLTRSNFGGGRFVSHVTIYPEDVARAVAIGQLQ